MSIGDDLAAARRQAGLTITQVSQRTCIRETIVRGIERGDYSGCGGDFYARGHIRSIARAVGLDPEELIREYDATEAPPQPITAADVFQPFTPVRLKERRRANWSVVLLVGVVAVLGIVGFRYFSTRHHNPPRPAAVAQTHHPKASTSPGVTKPVVQSAPTHVRVTLVALTGNVTWAEATAASGRILFSGDVTSAAKMTWIEKHDITVQLGNPAGVTLYLNGKKQPFSETTQPIRVICSRTACSTA
ncbi:MAG TPA: RodZ domain-containing protein [Streptosporangiaceae bacterium]|nr:RodZ domain-containing protein [Streptosporangiaceae bacterium]